jgi:hypothetical protein
MMAKKAECSKGRLSRCRTTSSCGTVIFFFGNAFVFCGLCGAFFDVKCKKKYSLTAH